MLLRDTSALAHFQHRGTRSEYRDDEPLASQLAAVYMAGTGEIFRVPLAGAPEGLALAEVVGARAAAPNSSLNTLSESHQPVAALVHTDGHHHIPRIDDNDARAARHP